MVFHGPREEVLPFFSSLGFQLPERKGIADFLQEVTSQKDQQVCLHSMPVHSGRAVTCSEYHFMMQIRLLVSLLCSCLRCLH